jgi:hypothetical protein
MASIKPLFPSKISGRAGDAAPGQECRVRRAKDPVRICQPFPMREPPGARQKEHIEGGSGNGDGIGGLPFAQTEHLGYTGGGTGLSTLRSVVKRPSRAPERLHSGDTAFCTPRQVP